MAIVSSDSSLYTTCMSGTDDTENFYRTFLVMVETINVDGRSAGFHPQLYVDHFESLCTERNGNPRSALTLNKVAIQKAKEDAKKQSCEEYLACLFILVADKS